MISPVRRQNFMSNCKNRDFSISGIDLLSFQKLFLCSKPRVRFLIDNKCYDCSKNTHFKPNLFQRFGSLMVEHVKIKNLGLKLTNLLFASTAQPRGKILSLVSLRDNNNVSIPHKFVPQISFNSNNTSIFKLNSTIFLCKTPKSEFKKEILFKLWKSIILTQSITCCIFHVSNHFQFFKFFMK